MIPKRERQRYLNPLPFNLHLNVADHLLFALDQFKRTQKVNFPGVSTCELNSMTAILLNGASTPTDATSALCAEVERQLVALRQLIGAVEESRGWTAAADPAVLSHCG